MAMPLPRWKPSGSPGIAKPSSRDCWCRAVERALMTPVSRTPQARLAVPSLSMLHSCASAAAERIGAAASTSAILFLFLLLVGLPLGVVLVQSFFPAVFDPLQPNWSFSVEALSRTFSSVRTFSSILNSLLLAGVVAVAATLVGAAYAVAVTRTDLPFPSACAVLPWLVFLTPAYLKGLAWVLLMSSGGYLAQLGLLSPAASDAFFTPAGLIFVHTLNLFPLSYFIMASALVGLGSEFEDAARLFGASPWRTWVSINAPLLGPALVLSALAIFAEVLSDFGLASTIARLSGFGLLTYGIYVAANDFPVDFALAGSQAIILLSMVLAVVLADRVIRRQVVARLISWRSPPARL